MEPVSSVLFKVFRGTPMQSEWVVACLEGAWGSLLGERLARVCRPLSIENGELRIEVLDEAWGPALEDVRGKLTEKIREATGGEARSISFRRTKPHTGGGHTE